MKNIIIKIVILVALGLGIFYLIGGVNRDTALPEEVKEEVVDDNEDLIVDSEEAVDGVVDEVVEGESDSVSFEVIGTSVEGRELQAYSFGEGEKTLVYVGALHGGYEWNSALLAYEMIDYFTENRDAIPEDVKVVVIPVANPDGLHKVVGTSLRFVAEDAPQFDFASEISLEDTVAMARFNANEVDLNRNFDCEWQKDATWRDYTVSAGTEAFSEPETAALRDFLLDVEPEAVVFYHSASNGIYTSFCGGDPLPGTEELLSLYSEASGYKKHDDYTYYEVTGDAADWLSTQGIPAITVELSTHTVVELDKNISGVEAMLEFYSNL